MSAVRATHQHGFQLVAAPPRQAPRQGEVLIRNIYVASNPKGTCRQRFPFQCAHKELMVKLPADWKLSEWNLFEGIEGSDVAGVVEAIGEGVAGLRHGDRVIACTPSATSDRCGAYQPFSIAPEHLVARIPPALSLEEAATLPLCFATASVAVHGVLQVSIGQQTRPRILVNGVGSSIGFYAAQLARHAGLDVCVCVPWRLVRIELTPSSHTGTQSCARLSRQPRPGPRGSTTSTSAATATTRCKHSLPGTTLPMPLMPSRLQRRCDGCAAFSRRRRTARSACLLAACSTM